MKIDVRSDTVTQPCDKMRQVMAYALVGDDVTEDDPTVQALQDYCADLLGKEAALFASSGVQANLLAIMSHCGRGDEYIVGQMAHTYRYEGGGAAVLGSIQPQPIQMSDDGTLDLALVESSIKPHDDFHYAKTRLLCLENTTWGKPLPMAYLPKVRALCDQHQLQLYLDGARLFNAAVYHQVEPIAIAKHFDSVSICLSKGLGAPVGSVLVGSKSLIQQAKHWRKMLGGGMRQAGIIAAGGLYALQHNVERLAVDHQNAAYLSQQLATIPQLEVSPAQTNMVFITLREGDDSQLQAFLAAREIIIESGKLLRFVTHLNIDKSQIDTLVTAIRDFFNQ